MTPSDTPKTLSKSLQAQEKPNLTVVKVGGAIVEDERQLTQLLQDFSAIKCSFTEEDDALPKWQKP